MTVYVVTECHLVHLHQPLHHDGREAARLMAGALWDAEADDEDAPRRRSGD